MTDTIKVICENLGNELDIPMGTSLLEISRRLTSGPHPFLAAFVNNRVKELNYKIYTPVTIRFIDITSFAGIRVYQRTSWFILQKAVRDLYPGQTLHIRHSMGQSGFYCEIEGIDPLTREAAAALEERMRAIVAADLPIIRTKVLTEEVRARYAEQGFDDKIALLDTRPRLYSELYTLGDLPGYFYGSLAPSTGYITRFGIEPYYRGFYLALPLRTSPEELHKHVSQEKMFGIFREYQSWVALMGVPTIGAVNARALAGDAGGMIKIAEAFHERKFAEVADAIQEAHRTRGVRMVLISGPSSSGKTTSAKRLGLQLGVLGLRPVMISLDDYFVEREKTPRDENGQYDYEALEAIDLELFNDHLHRLLQGQSVDIPRYDFITGRRTQHDTPLTLDERSILIIEGIHGLNPRLTPSVPDAVKFKIYISCFTSVAMDNLSRIATTDNRLLRRLTRDYRQRGADALQTLSRWASVRRGEERHIFPYQENADVMFNSSLFYEISVLRPFAEKILREVPDTVPEFDEARRMLKFLDNFIPIPSDEIPPTSILREFIGGSSFKY
ncbi:nucleoside kinase [uncultured Alistipes sp.]|uniref:nucleoside kinase n=1 Tax=uncultured Alistipes sp. TaxID=538949 RepID=UPI002666941F|nr:nucleoside kinase [uncultured Alistipes sp.]